MSSSLPPDGPPPGALPPPPPQGSAEYLESGSGWAVGPATDSSGSGLKKGLMVGGAVVGLCAIGLGAWAVVSFFATGAQPAEALPDSTLVYVSVDLDPSGGQKIEALRTLNKFPAFEDEIGIDTDDDIRRAIFDEIHGELDCDGLDYEDDIEPWLGERAAVAAVDSGGDTPTPVFVVQVVDADAADKGLAAIQDCAGSDAGGWAIEGDWAVIAESEKTAETVSADAATASLADDEDFQTWVGEAGDSGIVTMYAGPALGDYLAERADEVFGFPLGGLSGIRAVDCGLSEPALPAASEDFPADEDLGGFDECPSDLLGDSGAGESLVSDELKETMQDFQGMAGVLRFDDGAIELELASDGDIVGSNLLASDAGGETISSLPEDTVAAIGVGFSQGWLRDLLGIYTPYLGGGEDLDTLLDDIETETGLVLPDDIETLFGDSAALALGAGFDPEAVFESSDGSDLPVAVKVDGDPEEMEAVLEKLRDQFPPDDTLVFDTDSEGDTVVIGPNEDFRKEVLQDGGLGDDEVFKDVVREVDDASVVFFVNINELEDLVVEALGELDPDALDNVRPLSGFGVSGYVDDGVAHTVMRITTD